MHSTRCLPSRFRSRTRADSSKSAWGKKVCTWGQRPSPHETFPRERDSGEQRLADVLTRGRSGRDREERRAGGPEVLAQGVVAGHPLLDRDEAGPRVADEGEEEQAGVHSTEGVGAVDEVVPTAQHPRPTVV